MPILSSADILKYTGGNNSGEAIYDASKKFGFTPSDVDTAFGFVPGYSQSWVDDYLKKQQPAGYQTSATKIPTSTTPGFSGYTPSTISVDPNKSTVQGQLSGILRAGSPLNQLALSKSTQEYAKRGLQNSSMAAGGATKALIETALPIAQQDAQTHLTAQVGNMGAENDARKYTTDWTNRAIDLAATTDANIRQNAATVEGNIKQNAATAQLEATRDATAAKNDLTKSGVTTIQNTMSGYNNLINTVLANPELTTEQKNQQITALRQAQSTEIKLAGTLYDIDVGQFLTFADTPVAQTPSTNIGGVVNYANSTSATEEEAITKAYNYAVASGMSLTDVATQLGMTEAEVQAKLDMIGASLS